jgi:hypothetical protein
VSGKLWCAAEKKPRNTVLDLLYKVNIHDSPSTKSAVFGQTGYNKKLVKGTDSDTLKITKKSV